MTDQDNLPQEPSYKLADGMRNDVDVEKLMQRIRDYQEPIPFVQKKRDRLKLRRNYNFGRRLEALRIQKGLSRYQVGKRIGTTGAHVQCWEEGLWEPKLRAILALMEALEVSGSELLDESIV